MAIDNSITFGGINSADFGIYISGEGVFNAPQRDVEMISVPGRNGAIALDRGRFQNIEVTYPAFNYEADYDKFQQQLSDFRNAICAQKGYNRLSDTFHPDEYRMATYLSGLEVKPIKYNTASEFNIVFNCKPQRYLTSGEEEIDVTDWSDVKTLSGESVTFDDGDTSKGFQSIKTVFNPSQDGTPWKSEVESAPYLFRQSSGGTVSHEYDSESDSIVGASVAWNQLVANSGSVSVTVPSGHKYYSSIGGTKAIAISNGSAISATGGTDNIVDLTALFGSSTIADYLYSLEQTTAGAGIAKLKEWGFDIDSYHAYDAGSLQSVNTSAHETVGFNQWDEEWEVGGINNSTGLNNTDTDKIRSKNYVPVIPNTLYCVYAFWIRLFFYDAKKNFISYVTIGASEYATANTFTTPANAYYMRFRCNSAYGTTYNNDICINISSDRDGDYEPYVKNSYPLDSTKELRGRFYLDENNNLCADGDIYPPSGQIGRRYGIVDLGSFNWLEIGGGYWYQQYVMPDVKHVSNSAYANCMCPIYTVDTADNINFKRHDKVIGINAEGRIVSNDSGNYADANAYKAAMSGVYLAYELKTEVAETADPFTAIQTVDPYGTEEYVDYGVSQGTRDIAVPVGHQTRYIERVPINKLDKIITYVSPTSDEEDATTYETALGDSDYGGMVDVITGEFAKFWTGEIYTGQALGLAWFSDCDAFGTQPTYGAYVVTTTMEEEQLTGQDVQILNGRNVIWTNGDAHQLYPFPEYDKFVEVTYGVEPGKIYNPTLFDAQPLIKAKGEGSIFIGAKEVEILDLDFGDVELIPSGTGSGWIPFNKTNYDLMNVGDTITIEAGSRFPIGIDTHGVPINSLTITVNHSDYQCTLWNMHAEDAPDKWWFSFTIDEPITLQKTSTAGTSLQTSFGFSVSFGSQAISAGILGEIKYYPNNNGVAGIDFSPAKEFSSEMSDISLYTPSNAAERKTVSGYSTKPVSGGDYVYIDCELGEAYIFNEGEPVLLNRYIDLGSELPVLKPGVTEITADNTITDLVVEPRWWKI